MSAQPQPVNPNLPPDHVTVFVDGVEIAAPKGSMIIQAADKAGIPVPRFCYHDKLAIAANCRMCMVDTELGGRPAPKPSPACATPVADGLKVFTRSEKALKFQRDVMEFLLINHPLDCPICDQGGECELQDVAMGYGRSVSRFVERKRAVPDEDLGPLVATEMTRCIQCTRCVRFTGEIAGTYELGGMYRGENLQIGTFDGKPLMTELSGNVIDVCPVGALTNKVFQFQARPWELVARESLGYHDALGSNLFHHVRRGEILRNVPRDNEAVNECWLSDRDRYSNQGLYAEDRAHVPMVKEAGEWREASWDEALTKAQSILSANRGDALGVLVHPATSNEEGLELAALADGLGSAHIDHRIHALDLSDGAVAQAFEASVADIEHADVIVIVGSNIRHEVPLLHARVRKAWTRGAKIHVVNPVDFHFTFETAGKHIVPPSQVAAELAKVDLGDAKAPVVIVGGVAERGVHASAIRKAAREFAAVKNAKLCRIPQGANALGLTRAGVLPTGRDALAMLREPRKAYILHGIEPGLDFAYPGLAARALADAQVVAFTSYACQSTRAVSDVILPIGAFPEVQGSLTNLDGREQHSQAAGKPPRDAREGWRVLRALGGALGIAGFDFTDFDGLRASLKPREVTVKPGAAVGASGSGLEVAASDAIYRVDAVTRRSAALQAHPLNVGPQAVLHPQTATAVGLVEGGTGRFTTGDGTASLPVRLDAGVAPGCVWIERGYGATAPIAAADVEARPA
ncbi:NADH-quinone oxidoreductase subunit NuoG [Solilutibacter silvestris]|uniref:NADH-quinone oxidoreductase n=1 Tax=Solilutibacter silvestris TaxID=1645665 RepID=A0A2K1PZ03_9GAMM|nr:NADH-quinone oxidoreductase subunit NuoG [Lysobacter silvestris]PNS08024.1 NuoG: NADH dehydrogenase (quinone), G subunit [Lysobacter silvestris]